MASFLRAAHVVGRQATGIAPASAGVRAIGTVAPPTPSPAPSPYCSTFDFRRERQRADWWVNPTLEGDQLARNDEQRVNAALCSLKVVPTGASFRNLHLRGLRMLTPVSASKPYLTVDRKVAAKHKLFIALPRAVDADAKASLSFPEVAQFVDEDTSLAALRETRKHLSSFDTPKLFLNDGSINTGSAETLVRNVTDDSLIALTLSHTLLPTTVPNINNFAYSYSSLLSSSLPSSSLVDADLATTSFTLLDLERKIVVMGGQFAAPLLLRSLSAMSNYFVASQATGVPLPSCHSAVTTNGTSLVFGATQPVICPQLFGAHNNVWTQDGVSRSYNGALLDSVPAKYTPRAYDVLEKYSGNRATLISSHKTTQPYTAAHPKNVIFVVDDKIAANDALFTASAAQAVTLYKKVAKSSLLGVNIDSLATQFGALLETSKAKVYVVKASPNANDVQVAIANATSGAAAPKLDAKLFV